MIVIVATTVSRSDRFSSRSCMEWVVRVGSKAVAPRDRHSRNPCRNFSAARDAARCVDLNISARTISPIVDPKSYFKNIIDNVSSIAIGMKITLKYCFQKTVTVQYPEQRLSFAPRYRGIHEFEA